MKTKLIAEYHFCLHFEMENITFPSFMTMSRINFCKDPTTFPSNSLSEDAQGDKQLPGKVRHYHLDGDAGDYSSFYWVKKNSYVLGIIHGTGLIA